MISFVSTCPIVCANVLRQENVSVHTCPESGEMGENCLSAPAFGVIVEISNTSVNRSS